MAQKKGYGEVLGMGIWDGPGNITKESHLHGIFNLGSTIAISWIAQWSL